MSSKLIFSKIPSINPIQTKEGVVEDSHRKITVNSNLCKKYKSYGWFTLLGSIEGLLAIMIPQILFFILNPFHLSDIWISELGTSRNPYNYIFNTGLIISSLFLFYQCNRFLQLTKNSPKKIQ